MLASGFQHSSQVPNFKQCVTGTHFSSLLTSQCYFTFIRVWPTGPALWGPFPRAQLTPTPSIMNINVLETSFWLQCTQRLPLVLHWQAHGMAFNCTKAAEERVGDSTLSLLLSALWSLNSITPSEPSLQKIASS